MRRARKVTMAGLAILGVLAGGLVFSATSVFGAIGHTYETQITGHSPSTPFAEPWGLAFNGAGDLYVADPASSELGGTAVVDVFDPSNQPLGQIGSGTALREPYSREFAIGATGTLYVADSGPDIVHVLNALGEEQVAWHGANSPGGSYGTRYVSVAVDNSTNSADARKGDVYVAATGLGVVDVYKPAGEREEGTFEGQIAPAEGFAFSERHDTAALDATPGMAVDAATGNLYVPNIGNGVVDVFNDKGEEQPSLEPKGAEVPVVGSLGEPISVGLDESAHELYVVDRAHKLVDEFSMQGKYLGSIRGKKTAGSLVPFSEPRGVAIQQLAGSTHGDVYVSDDEENGHGGVDVFGSDEEGPTVEMPVTEAASGETAGSAVLHGELNPPPAAKSTVAWYFEYNRGEACTGGQTTPLEPEVEAQALKVSKEITGLEPDRRYTACVVAESNFGQNVGAPVSFTTSKVAPTVDEESVTNLTASSATIHARINAYNQETFCVLEYGTDSTLETKEFAGCGELAASLGDQPASVPIENLEVDTTYYYRVFAINGSGEESAASTPQSFKTVGSPLASTGEASEITPVTAALTGTIDPERGPTSYHFLYVDQSAYERAVAEGAANPYAEGGETIDGEVAAANGAVAAPPLLAVGLLPETTYHYALVATNNAGTSIGGDATFTTGAGTPPIVATGAASAITLSTATLAGTVNTRGLDVSYAFEVSTDPANYGGPSGAGAIGAGPSEAAVQTSLQGLQPGTTYYYRLLARSTQGTTYGEGRSFTTQGTPSLIAPPVAPPLIAGLALPFPADEGTVQAPPKTLTRAQKLTKALKACHAKRGRRRATCEKVARRNYGPVKKRLARRK